MRTLTVTQGYLLILKSKDSHNDAKQGTKVFERNLRERIHQLQCTCKQMNRLNWISLALNHQSPRGRERKTILRYYKVAELRRIGSNAHQKFLSSHLALHWLRAVERWVRHVLIKKTCEARVRAIPLTGCHITKHHQNKKWALWHGCLTKV